jgi:hypothetical protein
MLPAAESLVRCALLNGLEVSVGDGEAIDLVKSKDLKKIMDAVTALEEAVLTFNNPNDKTAYAGWARVSVHGLGPTEQVIDCTMQSWIKAWSDAYDRMLDAESAK